MKILEQDFIDWKKEKNQKEEEEDSCDMSSTKRKWDKCV